MICDNCHSEEIYHVEMRFVDSDGAYVLEQHPVKATYCVDCGVLEPKTECPEFEEQEHG